MLRRAIGPAKADQAQRQGLCRLMGCIACRMWRERGNGQAVPLAWPMRLEINHQTISGRQVGHDDTECLCSWHHRAICIPGVKSSRMHQLYGPSLARGSKSFVRIFGANDERLAYQNDLILGGSHEMVRGEVGEGF